MLSMSSKALKTSSAAACLRGRAEDGDVVAERRVRGFGVFTRGHRDGGGWILRERLFGEGRHVRIVDDGVDDLATTSRGCCGGQEE